jgi:hypothetical protein
MVESFIQLSSAQVRRDEGAMMSSCGWDRVPSRWFGVVGRRRQPRLLLGRPAPGRAAGATRSVVASRFLFHQASFLI